jgi:hypothetical protein
VYVCVCVYVHVSSTQLENMNIPGLREDIASLPAVAIGSDEDKIHSYPG